VVGGYLGAGKTTLLNRLLADPDGQRIAVLVNDFGEIDIDGRLLDSATDDVLRLANGCICCSVSDDFAETLDTVRGFAERIDRVVVEVSGVGQPHKVAQWAHSPGFSPDGIVVVVDPLSIRDRASDRYVGDTVVAQVARADLVVLSRTDVATDEQLTAAVAWLEGVTDATILQAPVPAGVLLGPLVRSSAGSGASVRLDGAPEAAEAHRDHVTISRRLDGPVSRSSIETWTRARPGGVVRAKGLVRVDDRPDDRTVLQVCGSSTTVGVDGPWDDGEDAVVAIALPGTPRAALVKWLNLLR
jgi:G3E family GTPase